jgi:hypothetical protein
MTRAITVLADRIVGMVVPKANALASHHCTPGLCWDVFCYCQGPTIYYKDCCSTSDCKIRCGGCYSLGQGC